MPSSLASVTERMQRADQLLDSLAESSQSQRATRLAGIAAEDPELARLLERLLAAWDCESSGGLDTGAAIRPMAASVPLPAGSRFGAFEVVRLLGRGGMGEVYLAQRADGQFDQRVAVKRILEAGTMQPLRASDYLTRERSLLARLQHPGIATLIDGGVDVDGFPWLAMEYIDGQALDTFLRRHPLGLRQRFDLLLQLIDAVAHAHRQLVVHGDLKPANILVQPDGRLRVLDFGIGSLLSEPSHCIGGSPATPGWASPEQRAGAVIGIASDQYQIARLALLLIAGDATTPAGDIDLSLRQRAKAAGLGYARQLDSALDEVLQRGSHQEPERRYTDLAALQSDLVAWREHRPIAARAGHLGARLRSLLHRHPLSVGLSALLIVAIAGSIWTLQQRNLELARLGAIAAAEAERSQRALDRRTRMLGFVERVFSMADPIGEGGLIEDIDVLLRTAADTVERQFPEDPDLRHEARAMLGLVALRRGQLDLAKTIAAAAADDAAAVAGSPAAGQALALQADLAAAEGKHLLAAAQFAEAQQAFAGQHVEHERWRLFLQLRQIDSLRLGGREDEARTLVPQMLERAEREGVSDYDRSDALNFAALLEPDPQRAYVLQQRAYDTLARVQSPDQPVMIKRRTNLAGTRMLMGDYRGATAGYAEALRRVADGNRLDSEYHAIAQVVYGRLLALQGQWQAAREWLERPVTILSQNPEGGPLLSYAEGHRLAWGVEHEPLAGLEAWVERWLTAYREQIGADHPRIREGQLLLARLARRERDFERALARLQAIDGVEWKQGTPIDEQRFQQRHAAELAGLLLDRGELQAACAQGVYLRTPDLSADLFHIDLVAGRAARLDAALCAEWLGRGSADAVAAARAALAALAGESYWLLQRR